MCCCCFSGESVCKEFILLKKGFINKFIFQVNGDLQINEKFYSIQYIFYNQSKIAHVSECFHIFSGCSKQPIFGSTFKHWHPIQSNYLDKSHHIQITRKLKRNETKSNWIKLIKYLIGTYK